MNELICKISLIARLKKTSKETKNKETFIKDGSLLNSLNSKIEQKKNEVKKIMEDRFRVRI